jgi:MFS family permease
MKARLCYSPRITRPGLFFAVAAVTVTAPRLALAFLAADGVVVPTPWRIDLLAVSSVATAVVLTGGIAYLAHAIAVAPARRGVLILLWTAALVCSGALIAPSIVATLRVQPLAAVLGVERHWSWSICVVLAVDLVASGAMLADARRLPAERVAHPVGEGAHPLLGSSHSLEKADHPVLTPPAQALIHPCPWGCGRQFTTKDAANGHGRHCPVLAAKRAVAPELNGGAPPASTLSVVRPHDHQVGDPGTLRGSRS